MKSKELFKKIGFKEISTDTKLYKKEYKNNLINGYILFGDYEITILKNHEWVDVSPDEIKAIYNQLLELGVYKNGRN